MTDGPADDLPESIVMWQDESYWVIKHERTGVTTQGESQIHALLMLADALAAYTEDETDLMELAEEVFVPDTDTVEFLEDLGYSELADEQQQQIDDHSDDE